MLGLPGQAGKISMLYQDDAIIDSATLELECGGAPPSQPQGTTYNMTCATTLAPDGACGGIPGTEYNPGVNANIVTSLNIPAWPPPPLGSNPANRHSNFQDIVTFMPPEWITSTTSTVGLGAWEATVVAGATLSLLNAACPATPNVIVNIPLYNCTTDTKTDPIPWIGDGTNLLEVNDTSGLPEGCLHYPQHVFDLTNGLTPRLRLFGQVTVVPGAIPTQLELVVFDPGQLVGMGLLPYNDMNDSLGYPAVVILDNPNQPAPPNVVTEFCAPLLSTTTTYGFSHGQGVMYPPVGSGYSAETTAQCYNGVDDDGDAVADDGCWEVPLDKSCTTNPANPKCCIPLNKNPNTDTGLFGGDSHLFSCYSESYRDADGDGFANMYDSCPYTAGVSDSVNGCDGCPAGTCTAFDQDSDGYANRQDNCPTVPNPGQADADHDNIGDACDSSPTDANGAYLNVMPRASVCVSTAVQADTDGWCDATETLLGSNRASNASTPENLTVDYLIRSEALNPAPQTCSDRTYYDTIFPGGDAVDNDGDTLVNAADSACSIGTPGSGPVWDVDNDGVATVDPCYNQTWAANATTTANRTATVAYTSSVQNGSDLCLVYTSKTIAGGNWWSGLNSATVTSSTCSGTPTVTVGRLTSGPATGYEAIYVVWPGKNCAKGATVTITFGTDATTQPALPPYGETSRVVWSDPGVPVPNDNCPTVPNPEQLNTDAKVGTKVDPPPAVLQGDACDADDDQDGATDVVEWAAGTDPKDPCSAPFPIFDVTGGTPGVPDGTINTLDIVVISKLLNKKCRVPGVTQVQ